LTDTCVFIKRKLNRHAQTAQIHTHPIRLSSVRLNERLGEIFINRKNKKTKLLASRITCYYKITWMLQIISVRISQKKYSLLQFKLY